MIRTISLLVTWVVLVSSPTLAGNIFAAEGIKVDVEASTSTEARRAALEEGHAVALTKVLRRLTPMSYWSQLPDADKLAIETMVSGFRVSDEKSSPQRYSARLSVSFKPDAIRDLIYAAQIPLSEVQSQPALLLPVMENKDGLILWTDNWWRDLWQEQDLKNGLVPFVLPLGDISDTTEAPVEDVLAGNRLAIDLLNRRYGTREAYIVHALADIDGQLGVTIYHYVGQSGEITVFSFLGNDNVALGQQAIGQFLTGLTEKWKETTAILSSEETALIARADFASHMMWRDLSSRLTKADLIRSISLEELTTTHAVLELKFVGSLALLTSNLEQVGLRLVPSFNGYTLVAVQ